MSNPYEVAARAERVLALLSAIDQINEKTDAAPAQLLQAVREQDVSWWHAMAAIAKIRPPSDETIAQTIRVLERRAQFAVAS